MKIEKKNTPKGPNQNQRFFFFCSATNPAHTHHQVSTSFAMITKYFNTVVVKYNPLLAACKYCTFFFYKRKRKQIHTATLNVFLAFCTRLTSYSPFE